MIWLKTPSSKNRRCSIRLSRPCGEHRTLPFFWEPVQWQVREVVLRQQQIFAVRVPEALQPGERDQYRAVLRARSQRQHVETMEQQ
ncbi:hypothetical protein [Burkholderia sp. Bp8963]|uniref:hypothetical protein n=1 Tax=Burkholderia sp. Bp8963 TaxID=2184547 RepID=UPI0021AB6398|nr:hypothetical protein [Burkholderia sp. Bp8963]